MDVRTQTVHIAALTSPPFFRRCFRPLVPLLIALLGFALLGNAYEIANATPLAISPTPTITLPAATAQSAVPDRATSTSTTGQRYLFLPFAVSPQAGTGLAIGIYQPQRDTSGAAMDKYISQVGKTPAFAWLPMTWQHLDGSYWQFDPEMLEQFRSRDIMPGLTWEPSKGPVESYADRQTAINQADFSWQQITAGTHDSYIAQFARDAAAYQYPLILRVLHEMNGTWYPWGWGVNGNANLADYPSAYQHIVNLFRAAGATNVQFVWNPCVMNATLLGQYGNSLQAAYPGDAFVDWVALDGYNKALDNWRSLQDIFEPSYQFITGFSGRPMILFEVGTLEDPQDPIARADWITQGFLTTIPRQFPRVRIAVWFNSVDGSGRDFSLNTPDALNAWKQVVSSPLYQGRLVK